jgi:hypothetical protein
MDKHFLNLPTPTPDVVLEARPADAPPDAPRLRVNVPRRVVLQSPAGFELGRVAGSTDLAVNILQAFLPGDDLPALNNTRCSFGALYLAADFRRRFLADLRLEPGQRHVIAVNEIKAWLRTEIRLLPPSARTRTLAVFDGVLDATFAEEENGGATRRLFIVDKVSGIPVNFGEGAGLLVSFVSQEVEMPFVHLAMKRLENKRVRVTVEEVLDEYTG